MIIGIDPGVSGAIAVLGEDGSLLDVDPMPHYWEKMKTKSKSGNVRRRRKLDIAGTYKLLVEHRLNYGATYCYIEKVHAMPKNGASSMFNFGEAYGIVQALAVSAGLEVIYVTPQEWKKSVDLIKAEKDASIEKVRTIFGDGGKIDHNMADACLIAWYGYCKQ